MILRLTAEARACLLDRTQPGSDVHEILVGAPIVRRQGDAAGGLYEMNFSITECDELKKIAAQHCPDAHREIEAEIKRQPRG